MNFLALLWLCLLAAFVPSAIPYVKGQLRVKEAIVAPPRGWTPYAPAPPNYILHLSIALHQPHWSVLEKQLLEVSDPGHTRYGDHLSREEIRALMVPYPDTLDAVNAWLAAYGIYDEHLIRSSAQDWLTIRVSVGVAEKMLATVRGKQSIRTTLNFDIKPYSEICHLSACRDGRARCPDDCLQLTRFSAPAYRSYPAHYNVCPV